MRDTYFKAPYAVVYSRPGPAAPFLDDFAESLHLEGYAVRTVWRHLRAAAHLGVWMQTEGIACAALDDRRIDTFIGHLSACTCVRGNRGVYREARAGVRVFLAHLRDRGIVPPAPSAGRGLPDILEQFQQWMLRHRGADVRNVGSIQEAQEQC